MKKTQKLTAALLLFMVIIPETTAYAATNKNSIEAEIFENKEAIENKYEEKNEIQTKKEAVNEEMQALTSQLTSVLGEIQEKESKVAELNELIKKQEIEVEKAEMKIALTEKEIDSQIAEIARQEEELALQQSMLDERVREAYKQNANNGILSLLLESKGFIDFFERLKFVEMMTLKDKEVITTINSLIETLEEQKKNLENTRVALLKEQRELEDEKGRLLDVRQENRKAKEALEKKHDEVKALEKDKAAAIKQMSNEELRIAQEIGDIMDENEKLEASLQALIREEQRKAEELRKKEEEKNNATNKPSTSVPSSQGYQRPTQGRISSPYGYRIHPIWNVKRLHTGIDYAAPTGTSIVATKSGTVITSRYLSSYGNTVIVDHGNGVSSLYAHMSSFSVSVGDKVSQGEKLGGVGSTGDSTGPHLHFEIRINGSAVDPANYLN